MHRSETPQCSHRSGRQQSTHCSGCTEVQSPQCSNPSAPSRATSPKCPLAAQSPRCIHRSAPTTCSTGVERGYCNKGTRWWRTSPTRLVVCKLDEPPLRVTNQPSRRAKGFVTSRGKPTSAKNYTGGDSYQRVRRGRKMRPTCSPSPPPESSGVQSANPRSPEVMEASPHHSRGKDSRLSTEG